MTSSDSSPVIVGRFGRARGVSGEIYVTPLTDFPERFAELTEILVAGPQGWSVVKVLATNYIGGRPVMRLDGITSPELAARLVNREVAVPRDQVVDLPEGSYYIFDLIGCQVVDEESHQVVGTLKEVQQYPANDVYLIEDDLGRQKVVAVVKAFVKEVDIAARKIVVSSAGLVDST